jgi:hypothetical protein
MSRSTSARLTSVRPLGVTPRVMKYEGRPLRGYQASDFEDRFARYLQPA